MTDQNPSNQYSFNNTPTDISPTKIVETNEIPPIQNNTYPNKDPNIPIETTTNTNTGYLQKKSKLIMNIGIILMVFSLFLLLLRLVFIK